MSKRDAYRRQAEAARLAIERSPAWLRETAVPPKRNVTAPVPDRGRAANAEGERRAEP
jgi:hypothetical protein